MDKKGSTILRIAFGYIVVFAIAYLDKYYLDTIISKYYNGYELFPISRILCKILSKEIFILIAIIFLTIILEKKKIKVNLMNRIQKGIIEIVKSMVILIIALLFYIITPISGVFVFIVFNIIYRIIYRSIVKDNNENEFFKVSLIIIICILFFLLFITIIPNLPQPDIKVSNEILYLGTYNIFKF